MSRSVKKSQNKTETLSVKEFKNLHKKKNKFNAIKVHADGYTFDSKAEYQRYCELKLLYAAGKISHLVVHPKYDLMDCNYVGDFMYRENDKCVIEDVKSRATLTPISRLKMKMFRRMFPNIELRIIGLKPKQNKARTRYRNSHNKPKCA